MNLNLTTATRYGLNCLALLGIAIALYLGRSIFVPLTIAALLAAIFWPSAKRLSEAYRFPWFLACMTTVVIVIIFGLVPFVIMARAVPGLLADLPRPNDDVSKREFYHKIRDGVMSASPFDTSEAFPEKPENSGFYLYVSKTFDGEQITNALLSLTKIGYEVLFEGVLILFIFLFLLLEGEMLARKIRNIFGPGPETQRRVTAALVEMAVAVRAYLVWRTIVNLGLAIVLGAVYHGIGLRQATLWAILTFVLCYVPYLGTIAAGIPPILDALYVGPGTAIGILIFYSAVVTFEGYIIVPWVMGRSMDLNATTVIMTCLFWDYVWGTAGLFLAMPLMAAIKAVCLQVDGWKEWGQLMGSGEDAVLPSVDHPEMVADSEAVDYAEGKAVERNGDSDATVVMESLPAELEEQLAQRKASEYKPIPPQSPNDTPHETPKPTE